MKHLLVTNDFPPKIGGIQSYLWELWRRLPADDVTVLTTPYEGAAAFDDAQPYRIVRTKQKWLLPTPGLIKQIRQLASETQSTLVVLDPVFPMGLLGPRLGLPYVLIGHGAEFTIPQKLPLTRQLIASPVRQAAGLIGGGEWVTAAMRRAAGDRDIASASIPPGVDTQRFVPQSEDQRRATRRRFGLTDDDIVVLGVSRLVPRKGFDQLITVGAALGASRPTLRIVIAGKGRQAKRLQDLARKLDAPVMMLGRVADDDLPQLYAAADVFCMPCHNRWWGLEQEGFGIVFVEAGSAGIPAVAGLSGGSAEAVLDSESGFVVSKSGPQGVDQLAAGLARLVDDHALRIKMGSRGRQRAVEHFEYDKLAVELAQFLQKAAAQ